MNTLLNTKIDDLSSRSQTITSELGGIEYNSDKDIKLADADKYIAIYECGKLLVSTRTRNGLHKIEIKNEYNQSVENKVNHIKSLFFREIDFLSIQNIGVKCKSELESLKDKITQGVFDNEEERKLYLTGGKYLTDHNLFPIRFSENEIEELFTDDQYSFKKMLCIFLFASKRLRKKDRIVLKNFFFNESKPRSKTILARELHCSFERVRQIQRRLYNPIIPRAVKSLLQSFKGKPFDLPEKNNNNILYLYDFPHFTFRRTRYTPNTEFSNTIYNYFLKEDYLLLNDIIIKQKFKSFEIRKNSFFISKKFMEETGLSQLLEWLDDQIYRFEGVAFNYNLEDLIKKYYNEIYKKISDGSLQAVYSLVIKIKKENFELNLNALKRVHKKNRIQSMLREVYSFLKEKNEGQTTLKILERLHEKNFETDKGNLLICLNKDKETFSFFGMGYWILKDWGKGGDTPSGSFRERVRNLLSDRDDPIHISELYEYFNSIKKVSLHSIKYNLKFRTAGIFKFFNCSYIGLSEKKYDRYWHKLPKSETVLVTKKHLPDYNRGQADIADHLSSEYGCPKQHVIFLFERKNGKYRIR